MTEVNFEFVFTSETDVDHAHMVSLPWLHACMYACICSYTCICSIVSPSSHRFSTLWLLHVCVCVHCASFGPPTHTLHSLHTFPQLIPNIESCWFADDEIGNMYNTYIDTHTHTAQLVYNGVASFFGDNELDSKMALQRLLPGQGRILGQVLSAVDGKPLRPTHTTSDGYGGRMTMPDSEAYMELLVGSTTIKVVTITGGKYSETVSAGEYACMVCIYMCVCVFVCVYGASTHAWNVPYRIHKSCCIY